MEKNAQDGQRRRKIITIHLLNAILSNMQGSENQSSSHLESALTIAAPQNYYRAFLDEGPSLLSMLPKVRPAAPHFIDQLLGTATEPDHQTAQVEPLTARELELLRLVARGLSNREIADVLFVTLGTVKKHLNNIFGKLDVKNRTLAVARGVELGLLD